MTLKKVVLIILCCAALVSAADISGKWKADLQHPNGVVPVNYTFKQDGEKLTGTWQSAQSPTVEITEGKVADGKVSFVVSIAAAGLVIRHEGKIDGDEIQFEMKPSGEFPGSTVVAKRVKQ